MRMTAQKCSKMLESALREGATDNEKRRAVQTFWNIDNEYPDEILYQFCDRVELLESQLGIGYNPESVDSLFS